MEDDELREELQHWEADVARREKDWRDVWAKHDTIGLAERRYINDVVPYKKILRDLRRKAKQPVCEGGEHCLEKPVMRCSADKHETCQQHARDCYTCQQINSSLFGSR